MFNKKRDYKKKIKGKLANNILIGTAIGDAVGVPYEFSSRDKMHKNPAVDMIEYGTHSQPMGTWSDDSSLMFCLAESLVSGYSLKSTATNFIKWKDGAYWTAHNELFDIGYTTSRSIDELKYILTSKDDQMLKDLKSFAKESDNGNGSLMRILPLIYEVKGKDLESQFDIIWKNSALTHKHIRAAMSCMIYLKFAEYLIDGAEKYNAYELMKKDILKLWDIIEFDKKEHIIFERVIKYNIFDFDEKTIMSGGYVIESLEASLWCFLNTDNFRDSILKGINFGHDTDTTAAIIGGISGIYYGIDNIPENWLYSLVRLDEIINLGNRLDKKYS